MRQITLITGGSRSGKSRFALEVASEMGGKKLFVATCPQMDDEMDERIRHHRLERAHLRWETVEEEVDLALVLGAREDVSVILVDCLTLWISNLLMGEGQEKISESWLELQCQTLLQLCESQTGHLILIGNEVGMGIVPENPLARRFRDLSGRCHQIFAARAHQVCLMVAGLPLWVKPSAR